MAIENKIVLVTGGANGIGFACATELLRNGAAHVAILDLANSNGEEAVSKLNTEFGNGKAIFVICDVTDPQQLQDGFAQTVEKFGGLDIVINNAGIMNDLRWELMININFNGVVRGTLLGLQFMGKHNGGKGGTIVNVSSLLGVMPVETFPIYAATKHAVIGLSRSFGMPYHYEKTGVRVLTLCPGMTETRIVTQCHGRTLDMIDEEKLTSELAAFSMQKIDSVALGMVHVIRAGKSGSVWCVENDKPAYRIAVPEYPLNEMRDE